MRIGDKQSLALLVMLMAGDLVALSLAHTITGPLRIALNEVFPRAFTPVHANVLFPPLPMVIPVWLIAFSLVGAYRVLGKSGARPLMFETTKAVSLAMGLQIVVLFFFTRRVYARSLFLLFWAVSLVLVFSVRALVRRAARHLKARGLTGQAVLVVGTGKLARLVADKLARRAEARYRFQGLVAVDAEVDPAADQAVLGDLDKVEALINEHMVDRVLVAHPGLEQAQLARLFELSTRLGVVLERVADPVGLVSARPVVSDLGGLPLVALRPETLTRLDVTVKRIADLLASGLAVIVGAPVLALLALAVKLNSPGPVLFVQRRVGRGGRHFDLYKFRSMYVDAERRRKEFERHNEADGHLFKMRRDPRVTRVGRLLRRWSLDELPQLLNVLRGDMSLVGPRPLPSEDLPAQANATPYALWLDRRRTVAPGVTGLWQVSGRSDLPFEEMVRLDLFYVENWSLGLDLQILWRTLPVIIRGQGAY
jgi:exopolysaccharide biosynthesis polyprenyl glycosylphosphotransferase